MQPGNLLLGPRRRWHCANSDSHRVDGVQFVDGQLFDDRQPANAEHFVVFDPTTSGHRGLWSDAEKTTLLGHRVRIACARQVIVATVRVGAGSYIEHYRADRSDRVSSHRRGQFLWHVHDVFDTAEERRFRSQSISASVLLLSLCGQGVEQTETLPDLQL